jgi:hypothetical protein
VFDYLQRFLHPILQPQNEVTGVTVATSAITASGSARCRVGLPLPKLRILFLHCNWEDNGIFPLASSQGRRRRKGRAAESYNCCSSSTCVPPRRRRLGFWGSRLREDHLALREICRGRPALTAAALNGGGVGQDLPSRGPELGGRLWHRHHCR